MKRNTDTVPAMLTPGEGVLNNGAMDIVGRPFVRYVNALGMQHGGVVPGYALGTSNVSSGINFGGGSGIRDAGDMTYEQWKTMKTPIEQTLSQPTSRPTSISSNQNYFGDRQTPNAAPNAGAGWNRGFNSSPEPQMREMGFSIGDLPSSFNNPMGNQPLRGQERLNATPMTQPRNLMGSERDYRSGILGYASGGIVPGYEDDIGGMNQSYDNINKTIQDINNSKLARGMNKFQNDLTQTYNKEGLLGVGKEAVGKAVKASMDYSPAKLLYNEFATPDPGFQKALYGEGNPTYAQRAGVAPISQDQGAGFMAVGGKPEQPPKVAQQPPKPEQNKPVQQPPQTGDEFDRGSQGFNAQTARINEAIAQGSNAGPPQSIGTLTTSGRAGNDLGQPRIAPGSGAEVGVTGYDPYTGKPIMQETAPHTYNIENGKVTRDDGSKLGGTFSQGGMFGADWKKNTTQYDLSPKQGYGMPQYAPQQPDYTDAINQLMQVANTPDSRFDGIDQLIANKKNREMAAKQLDSLLRAQGQSGENASRLGIGMQNQANETWRNQLYAQNLAQEQAQRQAQGVAAADQQSWLRKHQEAELAQKQTAEERKTNLSDTGIIERMGIAEAMMNDERLPPEHRAIAQAEYNKQKSSYDRLMKLRGKTDLYNETGQ